MTYEEFYGLVQPPFTLVPDPRFLYRSESHDEAITGLLQALRRKEGFIVLTGDIGTGKTTICRALLQQLDASTFTSLLLNPFLSVEELLREALLDFGVLSRDVHRRNRTQTVSTHELVSTLHDFLLSLVPIKASAVLIIDEAQHLSPQVLEQLRVLSNLETNETKLLQIVLVGQLNLLDFLADAEMRQLEQRISIRAMLKPLTREEVEAYIGHRLWVARGSTTVAFQPSAIDRVHYYSGGIPRVINLLCDRALMAGASGREREISESLVDKAAVSLNLEQPLPPPLDVITRPRARWKTAAIVVLALLALVGWTLVVRPVDTWIEITSAPAPARPLPVVGAPAQPYPIPTEDLMLPPPPEPPVGITIETEPEPTPAPSDPPDPPLL